MLRSSGRVVPSFSYHFHEGPFDGHDEPVDEVFLQPDIARHDTRTDTWHHYALVTPLPDFKTEPYELHYKHMAQFRPDGDYLEQVAQRRQTEMT